MNERKKNFERLLHSAVHVFKDEPQKVTILTKTVRNTKKCILYLQVYLQKESLINWFERAEITQCDPHQKMGLSPGSLTV